MGLCQAQGLIRSEGFAVDASMIEANASRYHRLAPEEIDWQAVEKPTRAVLEYIEALDQAGELEPGRKVPKVISPSDPASAWTAKVNKQVQFSYGLNYLIDNAHAVIVEVEATPARSYDGVASTKVMLERAERRFDPKSELFTAGTAYGTGPFLVWLVDKGIAPHIVLRDQSKRKDGTFEKADFRYDSDRDLYICPESKELKRYRLAGRMARAKPPKDGLHQHRARKPDCGGCVSKMRCCPKEPMRKVLRSVHEEARRLAGSLAGTDDFLRSWDERQKVEMRFAHLSTHHGFERMRLRGLTSARDEFHLAAIVQNLKTMALRLPPQIVPA